MWPWTRVMPSELFLRWLARLLVEHMPPRRPLAVTVLQVSREGDMLRYEIVLPPPGAPDVTARVLKVETPTNSDTFVMSVTELPPSILCEQGDTVTITLSDVDDADNISAPSTFSFIATDTIAPPAPGQVGVRLVEELFPPVEEEDTPIVDPSVPDDTPIVDPPAPDEIPTGN